MEVEQLVDGLPEAVVQAEVEHDDRPWHLRLSGGATEIFVRHPSLDSLKDDDLVVLAGLTLEAEWVFLDAVPVVIQVGWGAAEFEDDLFDALHTRTRLHSMLIGVQAGYRFWDALTPYVRVGFSGTWGDVHIDGNASDLGGWTFAAGAYAFAGVEATLPRAWMRRVFRSEVFTFGVRVEGGYSYLGRLHYGERADTSLLEHEESSLGTLALHGGAMNVGVVLAF